MRSFGADRFPTFLSAQLLRSSFCLHALSPPHADDRLGAGAADVGGGVVHQQPSQPKSNFASQLSSSHLAAQVNAHKHFRPTYVETSAHNG
jgi:hypothetical protein